MIQLSDALYQKGAKKVKKCCENHGYYYTTEFNGRAGPCPSCAIDRQADEETRREEKRRLEDINRRLSLMNVPKRFVQKTLDNYVAKNDGQKAALAAACGYAEDWDNARLTGRSLLLVGRPGTGKTHLAIAIGREIIENNNANVLYISLLEMLETIKEGWRAGGCRAADFTKNLSTVDLLIIDEVSSAYNSASDNIQFFRVINKRYENMLPTIIISNADKETTQTMIGQAAYDRLKDGGGKIITFMWESARK